MVARRSGQAGGGTVTAVNGAGWLSRGGSRGRVAVLSALALGVGALTAVSGGVLTRALAAPPPENACANPGALGVERIVEIDTKGGPLLGNLQYKEIDFLKPGEVVLTFDDGPSRQSTNRVLDALATHCTRATFFMVGRMAVAEPDMVRKVDSLGHTVGTHSWSHANQASLGADRSKREIELGISAVSAALGRPTAPFFRFPYLSDPKGAIRYLEQRDQGIFSIDVDTKDFQTRSASVMQQRLFRELQSRGKGIILFHDIQHSTATGIASVLDELKKRGYKIVHMVPKGTATTLAEFDAAARKELERRNALATAAPLANRSMVWPVTQGDAPPTTSVRRPRQPAAVPPPAATVGAPPAATVKPPPLDQATATDSPRPKPSWKREELPWQEQMFQHLR